MPTSHLPSNSIRLVGNAALQYSRNFLRHIDDYGCSRGGDGAGDDVSTSGLSSIAMTSDEEDIVVTEMMSDRRRRARQIKRRDESQELGDFVPLLRAVN